MRSLLTTGLPAVITAGVGMDVIAHCVETFLSPRVAGKMGPTLARMNQEIEAWKSVTVSTDG